MLAKRSEFFIVEKLQLFISLFSYNLLVGFELNENYKSERGAPGSRVGAPFPPRYKKLKSLSPFPG
jgi:hypothetical protein